MAMMVPSMTSGDATSPEGRSRLHRATGSVAGPGPGWTPSRSIVALYVVTLPNGGTTPWLPCVAAGRVVPSGVAAGGRGDWPGLHADATNAAAEIAASTPRTEAVRVMARLQSGLGHRTPGAIA